MEEEPPQEILAEIGRYGLLSQARERALVLSAMDVAHWIVREGPHFVLKVEPRWQDAALEEVGKYEAESPASPPAVEPVEPAKVSLLSLYLAAWLMGFFWFLQNLLAPGWMEKGAAVSSLIVDEGQWWRVFTALTLHGDLSHLLANLASGLIFSGFLLRPLGAGWAWLAIVCSGALGNTLNALFYRTQSHHSIGASTAVFGALGILVVIEFIARLASGHTRNRWQLVVPVGAGLALLAFLGSGNGESNVDYMAHFWGFVSGLVLGGAVLVLKKVLSRRWQNAAALAAPALLALAWWRAL